MTSVVSRFGAVMCLAVFSTIAVAVPSAAGSEPVWGEDEGADGLEVGVGFRIGGYGFREVQDDSSTQWTDCRMDGVGLFNTLIFARHWFTEASLDYYQAIGSVVNEGGMDRQSLHLLGAIGFRGFPEAVFSLLVQLGVGAEYTSVEWMDHDAESHGVYPMGFIGLGGEVKAGDHVRLGINLRAFMMAAFAPQEHTPSEHGGHVHSPTDAEAEAAGQVQFWLRYDI